MGDLEITQIGALQLFEMNKEQRQAFATNIIEQLNEGFINPISVHYNLKCILDIAEIIMEDNNYKALLRAEAEKHGKEFTFKNAIIKLQEVGTKYDYSNCNDTIQSELAIKAKEYAELLKNRQKFLQLSPIEGADIVDENGEVRKVYPPAKSSTSSIVFKFN